MAAGDRDPLGFVSFEPTTSSLYSEGEQMYRRSAVADACSSTLVLHVPNYIAAWSHVSLAG